MVVNNFSPHEIRIEGSGRLYLIKRRSANPERLKEKLVALGDKLKEYEKPETIPGRVRPRLINISNCQMSVYQE